MGFLSFRKKKAGCSDVVEVFADSRKDSYAPTLTKLGKYEIKEFCGDYQFLINFECKLINTHHVNAVEYEKLILFVFEGHQENFPGSAKAFCKIPFFANDQSFNFTLDANLPSTFTLFVYNHKDFIFDYLIANLTFLSQDGLYIPRKASGIWNFEKHPLDLRKKWSQSNQLLEVTWLGKTYTANMPIKFDINQVTKEEWRIVEDLLFGPLEEKFFLQPRLLKSKALQQPTNYGLNDSFQTKKILHGFSAGEDSTAALELLPKEKTINFFCNRSYRVYRLANGHPIDLGTDINEIRVFSRTENLIRIFNDFEKIGISLGEKHGFQDIFGYTAFAILLRHVFDANVVSLGYVLDALYLKDGVKFEDMQHNPRSRFYSYKALFARISISLAFPVGYCSEVITNHILHSMDHPPATVPCPITDKNNKPCGQCIKCFRKMRFQNKDVEPPGEKLYGQLKKRPLHMSTCIVYAAQKSGFNDSVLADLLNVDVSFLENYYGEGQKYLVPKDLQGFARQKLQDCGVSEMSHKDVARMKTIGKAFYDKWAN